MAQDLGYHILYLARNHGAWICPERVGRHQPNDPLDLATPNHFLTRAAANDYIRRRDWKHDLRHRVEACTWDKDGGCLRAHLPEWLEERHPSELHAWEKGRRSLASAKSARRRERTAERKAAFQHAVAAEVQRRLADLGIADPPNTIA